MFKYKNKTVVLGMSGGVDSSVSALLLKKQGFNVIGLFMQNWDTVVNNDILGHKKNNSNVCDPVQDFLDAKKVADKLNIPLYRVEFIKEYWDNVFKYFLNEYKNGRTPNPDILCNKFIKFDAFIDYAFKKFKCDYIAMGHYARTKKAKNGCTKLLISNDKNKDQTYFLCYLSQDQISKVIFPIGNIKKSKVRKIAIKNYLATAKKKDSTGICFIGERKFKDFLANYFKPIPGNIIDIRTNKIIGKHSSIHYFTIGQNSNLNLGGNYSKYYICKKDNKKNDIFVVEEQYKKEYLESNQALIEKVNWINKPPKLNKKIMVRFRHRQKLIKCKVIKFLDNSKIIIRYKSTMSVTPGQFAVFYHKNECLGGGIISNPQKITY